MTARTLTVGGGTYPLVLPSIRDPRLHVAAVIITIHVLGQLGLDFWVSIPQILAAILTCAIIEVALTFRQSRAFVWPASAMLTGSGVALILRVVGTPQDQPWDTYAWYVFAAVAGLSLLTKYVIRYRGSHVFNPSNIGLVLAFVILGSTRVEPLDFWWGPLDIWMLIAYTVIIGGGLLITRRLRLLALAATFWVTLVGRRRDARRVRSLHDRAMGVRARLRRRLRAGHRHLAGGADLPVLHDHRPEDLAGRARRTGRLRLPRGRRERPAHGAADQRVRDQGRAAGRTGRRVRGPARPRPLPARAEVSRRPVGVFARRVAVGGGPHPGVGRIAARVGLVVAAVFVLGAGIVVAGTPARGIVAADT